VGFKSKIQGYNVYSMLHFHRKFSSSERVQKGIAYWDKQNNDIVPASNCMLKV